MLVGPEVGLIVGARVGLGVGLIVGARVGLDVGATVGILVGDCVGRPPPGMRRARVRLRTLCWIENVH